MLPIVHFADFLRHMRRRWYLYLPVFAIWGFAYVRLFIDATPRLPVLFNWTPSLPYRSAGLVSDVRELHRGDYVVFAFAGAAQADYPDCAASLLQDRPWTAWRCGHGAGRTSPSTACRSGRQDPRPRRARWHRSRRRSFRPATSRAGTSPDSFDSRYAASGLVRADQVIGRAVLLF